jgi:hypothetical protein
MASRRGQRALIFGWFIRATAVSPKTLIDTQNEPLSDVFKYACDRSTVCNQRWSAPNWTMEKTVFWEGWLSPKYFILSTGFNREMEVPS